MRVKGSAEETASRTHVAVEHGQRERRLVRRCLRILRLWLLLLFRRHGCACVYSLDVVNG
jgi:hypothetical protein